MSTSMEKSVSSHSEQHRSVLAWEGLTYTVKDHKTGAAKHLVNDVSGRVQGGELLAVMGPSGAGKSTFLDLIASRKTATSGSITLDGSALYRIGRDAAYVEQEDALLGVLTIRETLSYSARLTLPRGTDRPAIRRRVEETIVGLGLAHVADNIIGTPIQRGISGGQKRRVTIGNALVSRPRILFLDEPTSGLDSATAFEVMAVIRQLAVEHGIAIVASIHSPNWATISLFDRVLLLAAGQTMYDGPVTSIRSYFTQRGQACDENTNPADHMLSVVSSDFGFTSALEDGLCPGNVAAWAAEWSRQTDVPRTPGAPAVPSTTASADKPRSLASKTWVLTERNFLNYSRNILAYGVRVGMYIGMAVLIALVWMNMKQVDDRINDRLSIHFFMPAFLGFMAVAGIPALLEERSVMLRERRNNQYTSGAFVIANTLVTLPFLFLITLLFSVIVYWSIGLNDSGAGVFFRFVAYLYLALLCAEFQALLIAAVVPIFVAALALGAFANGLWMATQGYFARRLPSWLYYSLHFAGNWQTFAFQNLVKNDLDGLVFPCAGSLADATCQCSFPSSLIAQGQCAVAGSDVTRYLGFDGVSTTLYAFLLLIIAVVFRLLFWAAIAARK